LLLDASHLKNFPSFPLMASRLLFSLPNLLLLLLLSFGVQYALFVESVLEEEMCEKTEDCVIDGQCLLPHDKADANGTRFCFCSKSCISSVPVECSRHKQCVVDLVESTHQNFCDKEKRLCLCRARKDNEHACLKKNLKIIYLNTTRSSVYLGESFKITCCVNIEPRSVRFRWLHNDTEIPSTLYPDLFQLCWTLNVTNARFADAGYYTCSVKTDAHGSAWLNASVDIQVRGSRFFAFVREMDGQHLAMTKSMVDRPNVTESRYDNSTNFFLMLNATGLNEATIMLDWVANPASSAIKFRVEALDGEEFAIEDVISADSKPHIISGLKPASHYSVSAETVPGRGRRPVYDKVVVQTLDKGIQAFPSPPQQVNMRMKDEIIRTKCELSWMAPLVSNGPILYYMVDVYGVIRRKSISQVNKMQKHRPKSVNCQNLNRIPPKDSFMQCEFEGLLPNHNYSARVVAVNALGESPPSMVNSKCLTSYGPPPHIETPIAEKRFDDKTIRILFSSIPDDIYGPITCYFLAIVPCTRNYNMSQLPHPVYMNFDVYERAMQSNLHIMFQPIFAYISEAFYSLPRETIIGDGRQTVGDVSSTLDFLGRFPAQDGELQRGYKYTGFLIVRVDPDNVVYNLTSNGKRELLQNWLQPTYGFSNYFKPVFLGESDVLITEDHSRGYQETIYLLAVGFSVVSVLVVFGTVLCFYYSHIRGWLKTLLCVETNFVPDRNSFADLQRVAKRRDFQPTAVEDLPNEYLLRHRDSNFLFTVEFESLPNYNFDTTASDKLENAPKNRYNDIKAFDITRVKLERVDDDSTSDYINANYVQGYKGRKLFIAAQGPTLDTVNDFWRLVWEQNVNVIVMVTNLQERYRHSPSVYGRIEVKPLDCTFYADYVIRNFTIRYCRTADVSNSSSSESESNTLLNSDCRSIVQYHFTGWQDYRAPEGSYGFLRFMKQFKRIDCTSECPVLVHCSAGVGRTGTFVAVDSMMDQMVEEGRVDVFGFVSNLRRQRNFMVQSLDQYVFIYKALAEWYMFGDTDVDAERVEEYVIELRQTLNNDSTGLEKQYNLLFRSLEDTLTCNYAKKSFNEQKNRFKTVVAYDRNRVILAPLLGHEDATYINASLVRGYFYSYILTQDPLSNTRWDFWRMILEHGVASIVMLTGEEFLDQDEMYWPSELNGGSICFGDKPAITVQLLCEEESAHYSQRKFKITSTKEKELHEVVQFCFHDWANGSSRIGQFGERKSYMHPPSIPASTASLFDLVGKVSQRQNLLQDAGPIVVHCRDGAERSGLYCAVSLLLERLRGEGKVDVFQTVKSLQAQRAHIIPNVAQYEFCYQCVLDYLRSFS
ncbi:Receptor-type tyrosine-protein phosphatase alpha, partial [Trichinella pseudospiralis]